MKTNFTQKEILLMTGTQFSARQGEISGDNSNHLSDIQKLEQACWNGLLKDILPELFKQTAADNNLYLWQVKAAATYLELEFGEHPEAMENYFSIDPHAFIPECHLS
jgi:hypothetical protein